MNSRISTVNRRSNHLPVIVIGCTLLMLLSTVAAGFAPAVRTRLGWTAVERTAYSVGDAIDIPADLRDRTARTLVVFASGTCGACLRSTSALTRLSSELRGSSTTFLLVTPTKMKADQEIFVAAVGLAKTEYVSLDLSALKVRSVPTVVLVDESGRVLFSREGYVDDAVHDAVMGVARGKQS
jgi:thioredoxin-related protein